MSKMNQSGSTNGFLPANSFIESLGFEESTNDVAFILDVSVTLKSYFRVSRENRATQN